MTQRKIRVLLDLSMAGRGYCGIAQDVRLIYKMLATCPDVEVTGLLYPAGKFNAGHRFRVCRKPLANRLEYQSRALWAMAGDPGVPDFIAWKILRRAFTLASILFVGRGRLDTLETEFFSQVVWRLFFQQSLSPSDMPLVQNGKFLLSNLSDRLVYSRSLTGRRPLKIDTRGYDFLIVQGPRPFRIDPSTRQIVRYQDMIPVMHPDTLGSPLAIKAHRRGLRQCVGRAYFACNTDPTRNLLSRVYPEVESHSATIPCAVSNNYHPDANPALARSIIETRRSSTTTGGHVRPLASCPRYLICVSTLEPRKNFPSLVQAFNVLRHRPKVSKRLADLKLVIVGSPGWRYTPILKAMKSLINNGDLIHLESVTSDELRVLYTHAEALVFPSYAEGFGIPPLEAMHCDTPVIASDVQEHRWVLGDAALYCNSYDVGSIADSIERLIASGESASLRGALVARGRELVKRYSLERCGDQWVDLLERLQGRSAQFRVIPQRDELKQAA